MRKRNEFEDAIFKSLKFLPKIEIKNSLLLLSL